MRNSNYADRGLSLLGTYDLYGSSLFAYVECNKKKLLKKIIIPKLDYFALNFVAHSRTMSNLSSN